MMRIVAYRLPKMITDPLKRRYKDVRIHRQALSPKNADPEADIVVLTLTSKADRKAISKMKKLKGIVTASTGKDHIDLDECSKRGITVRNCPEYSANAVAEHAIALAFAGLRSLNVMLRHGDNLIYPSSVFLFTGHELSSMRCAVLGTGTIGSLIAKKLISLGCKVMAFSRSEKEDLLKLGVTYHPLGTVLKKADIVFISLPSTKATYHLLDSRRLGMMKKGSGIVNIARGELIDTKSLQRRIGKFGFVAADVIEGEAALWLGKPVRFAQLKELVQRDNFLLTPHIGASTAQAKKKLVKATLDAVKEIKKEGGL